MSTICTKTICTKENQHTPRKKITPISAGIADALGIEKSDAKKIRAKITYVPRELPAEGYVRKPTLLDSVVTRL